MMSSAIACLMRGAAVKRAIMGPSLRARNQTFGRLHGVEYDARRPPARLGMKTDNEFFRAEHLFVMDATGVLDAAASRIALAKLAADPDFSARCEVLMDLRDIKCAMSASDIYELAIAMAWPNAALPTNRKVAILVEGRSEFDHASFLALCATNRGLSVAAFEDYDTAGEWLVATLPTDPKDAEAGDEGPSSAPPGAEFRSAGTAKPML
jgi:hypothetical protein